jgi:hypothetical protein
MRPYFKKPLSISTQIERIKKASDIAHKKIDYDAAHNREILHAINIVELFLKETHRLCYGGQAINAHLPEQHKIYDPEYNIPDYDFFSPSQERDVEYLLWLFKSSGYSDVAVREGMHEGTLKIYVDYNPVADITAINPTIYDTLYRRAFTKDGISYLDANTLRMLMYLELSRPEGEVERWPKVYERLAIFNEHVPHKSCNPYKIKKAFKGYLSHADVNIIIDFIIKNEYIFAGASLVSFYDRISTSQKAHIEWVVNNHKPIIFYSSHPPIDASYLLIQLNRGSRKFNVISYDENAHDLVPKMQIIMSNNKPVVFIIDISACHSYITMPLSHHDYNHKAIHIASLDTLITLYFSIGLAQSSYFDIGAIECVANQLVHISIKERSRKGRSKLPFISIKCKGYQSSMPSLIRAKVERIKTKKKKTTRTDYTSYANANANANTSYRHTLSRKRSSSSKHS